MSAAERWERAAQRPDPKPLAQLDRPALCARIHVLRATLDLMDDQVQADGAEGFRCKGRVKLELIDLEQQLFRRDRAALNGEPMPPAVLAAAAGRRPA